MNTLTLKNIIQFIDVVTSRGAIRGEELSAVGELREDILRAIEEAEAAEQSVREEAYSDTNPED